MVRIVNYDVRQTSTTKGKVRVERCLADGYTHCDLPGGVWLHNDLKALYALLRDVYGDDPDQ